MPAKRHSGRAKVHGRLVREYRELRGYTVKGLLAHCTASGVTIDEQEYREVEAGGRLPADPTALVQALTVALALSSREQRALLRQPALALLDEELGEDLVEQFFAE